MDHKTLENQLKNSKIREGPLYKRSKFLKQWRERWIVLTMNYLITFTNKTCKEVTDVIDLKEIKSYKSYVRKDQEMIPAGFKIRSEDNQFYFCGRNASEKWSWLVTFERLMDYKYIGSSTYNNIDFIRTRGFMSQVEFQNGGKIQKTAQLPQKTQQSPKKSAQEAKKQVDQEVQKIMKELQNQKQQLKQKEAQFSQKQKTLKQHEQQLKKQEQERKRQEKEQINIVQPSSPEKKQTVHEIKSSQPAKKPQKIEKKEQAKTVLAPTGSIVSNLKNMFQQKIIQSSKETAPSYKLTFDILKHVQKKSKYEELHKYRSQTVSNLFQQFHNQSPQPEGLKFTLDFLIKMASNQKYGYNSSVVKEIKVHQNRKVLAQFFVQLITDYKDFQNCYLLARFIEICIFESPDLFTEHQIPIIANKLIDFLLAVEDENKLEVIAKNMFILNRMSKYHKNEKVKEKLNQIISKGKRQQTKNWARKLIEEF